MLQHQGDCEFKFHCDQSDDFQWEKAPTTLCESMWVQISLWSKWWLSMGKGANNLVNLCEFKFYCDQSDDFQWGKAPTTLCESIICSNLNTTCTCVKKWSGGCALCNVHNSRNLFHFRTISTSSTMKNYERNNFGP